MYANGSGREGAVSKGSARANGEAGGTPQTAESACGERDNSGVVAWVAQALAGEEKMEGALVPLLLPNPDTRLKGELSECDVIDPPTGGRRKAFIVLWSRSSLGRLTAGRRGSSPKLSGINGGPCRKLATAADAALYNHAVGKSPGVDTVCLASPSSKRSWGAGPDGSGTGSPIRALPLSVDRAVSRRLVYPPPPCCGGSMSTSCILDRSMTSSPLIAQPPVPYPPALTDGDNPCLLQKIIILKTC